MCLTANGNVLQLEKVGHFSCSFLETMAPHVRYIF